MSEQASPVAALDKFPIVLTCACGDEWEVNPPVKFRTQAFLDYTLAKWHEQHDGHLRNGTEK